MITVRFPSGVSILYMEANYVHIADGVWRLMTKENGKVVVAVSPASGCVVEMARPAKIENPLDKLTNDHALLFVLEHLRDFDGWSQGRKLRELKAILNDFDARTLRWRE